MSNSLKSIKSIKFIEFFRRKINQFPQPTALQILKLLPLCPNCATMCNQVWDQTQYKQFLLVGHLLVGLQIHCPHIPPLYTCINLSPTCHRNRYLCKSKFPSNYFYKIVLEIRKHGLYFKLSVLDFRKLFLNTFYDYI